MLGTWCYSCHSVSSRTGLWPRGTRQGRGEPSQSSSGSDAEVVTQELKEQGMCRVGFGCALCSRKKQTFVGFLARFLPFCRRLALLLLGLTAPFTPGPLSCLCCARTWWRASSYGLGPCSVTKPQILKHAFCK